jgi:signal transduction histidine kinase/HAMP domain-containing protein
MTPKRTFKISAPRDWPLASKFSLAVVIVAVLTAATVLIATRIAEQSTRDQAAGQMVSLIGAGVAVVIFAVVAGNFAFLLGRRLTRPLVDLTEATERLGSGQFDVSLPKYGNKDEIGRLTASFETMVIGLRDLFATLEERVAKRVHELELAAEVGRRTTAVVELDVLLAEAVELIRERFDLYYAQIYLLDDARQFAVMREGTGTVGQQLKAKGHKIPLGAGLVGTAAEIGLPVVVPDTHQDPTHLPNPLLPDTRSESAVPLLIGEEVIGVLDMQSNQPGTFSKENVPVFIALAGQLAIAINNARLFDEVSTARQHAEKVTRQLTREGWEEYLHSLEEGSGPIGYSYDLAGTSTLDDAPGSISPADDGLAALIQVRGEQIGSLVPQDLDRELTDEEKEILQAVADRVALRIENLRLFEQTQVALSQTEALYAASERLSRAEDIEGVLDVLVESTALRRLDWVSVLFFERPLWPDRHLFDWQQPSAMTVAATWEHGSGEPHMPVGTRYGYDEFPAARVLVVREGPAIIRDAGADERLTGDVPAALEELGVRSSVSWSLEVGGQWIGFLSGQSAEALDLNEAEMRQISTLVDQAATVIQNLRLYEQAQDALSQAETLYVGSERLGRAATIGDVLNALLRTTDLGRLDRANIQFFDRPVLPDERPESMTVAAVWERGGKEPRAPVGTRYDFSQLPAAELLNPNEPTVAGDIATDERMDENTRALFLEQLGMRGVVFWPLTVGKQWVGVLSGQSIEALDLGEDAIRQIDALADQAATVIENLRLFEQTQVALSQTEALYAAGGQLSRAEDVEGALDVLVESTALGRLDRVSVLFFERPLWPDRHLFDWQQPSAMTVAATWERSGEEHMPVGTRYGYDEFPAARVLVVREGPAIIRDAAADERLTGDVPAALEELGVRSSVSWSLEVGGQWIGFLSGQSAEALDLNEAEMRQIGTLVDQAATVIQNLRLYEQTQDALSQAETLYVGSERLGRAATIEDVLNALLRTTDLGRLDRANIQFFDRPVLPDERPEGMTVVAVWERGGKEPRAPVGTRYDFSQLPAAELLDPNEPTIVGDMAADERMDENTRALFLEQLGMRGVVFWPLTVGKQWIGMLSGQSTETLDMDEDAIRQIDALADQAAAVIQNLRLFEQTQMALAELNLVLSSMTNYMFVIDAEDCFAAVYANPEAPDLPAPPAVFAGKPYREIMPENVSERIATALKAVRETGQPATIEYALILSGGEVHYEATFSPVTGTTNVLAVATNITERKRAELREHLAVEVGRQLTSVLDPDLLTRQVVDLVRSTFDYYHVHIYALDEEGKMLVVREGTGEAGRVMRERGHSIALDAEPSLVAQAARTGQPVFVDDISLESAHLPNPLLPDTRSEVAIPLVLGERVLGVLDVQDDQAERFGETEVRNLQALAGQLAVALSNAELYSEQFETAERLRELDRLKGEFLANMSHELRTPLNSIIGYAEVLLDGLGGPLTELAQEDVQAIHSSGHHLLALINDILDIAKIEASQLELDLSEIDLNEFLPELIDMTQVLTKDRPVELQLEIGEDVSEVVADEVRLRQILWNLLSNAIKFTEKGHVTLRCRPDDSQIIFEVEDTGIGIAPEDQEKIFEQFRQVDGSATRRAGGSGLGLAITRHLVQLHGGRIWLDSQVGQGSTFYFNLPINHEEAG